MMVRAVLSLIPFKDSRVQVQGMAPPTFRVYLPALTTLIEIVLDHPSQTRLESCLLGDSRSFSLDSIRVTKHTRNKGGVVLLMGSEVSVWWCGGMLVCRGVHL